MASNKSRIERIRRNLELQIGARAPALSEPHNEYKLPRQCQKPAFGDDGINTTLRSEARQVSPLYMLLTLLDEVHEAVPAIPELH